MAKNTSVREIALEKISRGTLKHVNTGAPVTIQDIDAVLGDLRALTEGGVHGIGGG